ncbi:tumor necrosis factor ligand superfamily member 14 isoform X2 [Rhineura floridana]|uniref:tumor necrosis factor ligand superfamily member 14 isoform X2 n=1 Tax=Rhineura floridana TaxID=261503 RepID=UPI002AC87C7D|nr:tumor necrosis factor ligand superfamily member 14 isoform X2 [Rhineura floridana]
MEDRYPSIFVVDTPQRDVPFVPPVQKTQKKWQHGQLLLGILVLLTLAGLAIQAYFLICFRKDLDKVTSQGDAHETYEKLVQGSTVTVSLNGSVEWQHVNGSAFLQDMGYKDGSLICNQPGHYYIYSKLYLGQSSCPEIQQKSEFVVTHAIYKRTSRYQGDIKVLTNIIPYCNWKDSKEWRHNSFLAGMVQLEEKEEVFIKVSKEQLLWVKDDSRSYFGTFMI